jgi:hypothetical protein
MSLKNMECFWGMGPMNRNHIDCQVNENTDAKNFGKTG